MAIVLKSNHLFFVRHISNQLIMWQQSNAYNHADKNRSRVSVTVHVKFKKDKKKKTPA